MKGEVRYICSRFPYTEYSTEPQAQQQRESLMFQQGSAERELTNCWLISLVESVPPCSTSASYNSCVSQQVACKPLPLSLTQFIA